MFKPRERQDEFGFGSKGESKQLSRQRNSMSRALRWEEEDLKGSQPAESRDWRQTDALTNQAVQKLGPRSSLSRHKGTLWTLDLTFKGIESCQRVLGRGDDSICIFFFLNPSSFWVERSGVEDVGRPVRSPDERWWWPGESGGTGEEEK